MPCRSDPRERSKHNVAALLDLKDALISQRKARGLTQKDVAERMGVSQPAVSEFERYDSNPTLRTLRKYATAVEATLSFAVSGRGPSEPRSGPRAS